MYRLFGGAVYALGKVNAQILRGDNCFLCPPKRTLRTRGVAEEAVNILFVRLVGVEAVDGGGEGVSRFALYCRPLRQANRAPELLLLLILMREEVLLARRVVAVAVVVLITINRKGLRASSAVERWSGGGRSEGAEAIGGRSSPNGSSSCFNISAGRCADGAGRALWGEGPAGCEV